MIELVPPGACRTRVEGLAPVTEASLFPAAAAGAGAGAAATATAATGAAVWTTGVGAAAGAGAALATGAEESPKLMLEPPPGGASTRLVGRVTLRSLDINLLIIVVGVGDRKLVMVFWRLSIVS